MSTEIHRVRPVEGGRIRFEVECDDIAHFSRVANEIMRVVPEASAPTYSHAQDTYEAKRRAAEAATGRFITAYVPPYDTTLGGQSLPVGDDEVPLRAGEAFVTNHGELLTADECRPGGTD